MSLDSTINELVQGLAPGRPGPLPAALSFSVAGPVEAQDLVDYKTSPQGGGPPPLKRLRASHHRLAQLVASGTVDDVEASSITGYTPQRIRDLRNYDPAFRELIHFYQTRAEEVFEDFYSKLAALRSDSVETLHERVLENPEDISTKTLLELAKFGADRTGFPAQTSTGAGDENSQRSALINEIKQSVKQANRVHRIAAGVAYNQTSYQAGIVIEGEAVPDSQTEKTQGRPRQGQDS